MADGTDIHLDATRVERLRAAAQVAGLSLEDYALKILDRAMEDDWAEATAALVEFDRTGHSVPAEDALRRFQEGLTQRLNARQT